LLIQKYFNATPLTREREAQRREYRFDDSFTRVTGLICQLRRGNANFFFPGLFHPGQCERNRPLPPFGVPPSGGPDSTWLESLMKTA